MLSQLRPALVMIAIFTLLTGVVFPLGFVGLGQLVFPYQAGGSLISANGRIIGSALIGQNFTSDKYFHGRASALTGTDPKDSSKQVPTPYDAGESGASNLGPTNKALIDRVTADVATYPARPVPADAVTSSASGLDPDISPENARTQLARVAKARGVAAETVNAVVNRMIKPPALGFIGAPRVNVLQLNMALDELPGTKTASR
jgi:K+-transporting ATPase ATPase C chain